MSNREKKLVSYKAAFPFLSLFHLSRNLLTSRFAEKMNRDVDDLTPLDARESLLMEHRPSRKDDSEMSKFNFTGPYQPYRDHIPRHSPTGSTDHLVAPDYFNNQYRRSSSRDSRDSNHSLDGRPAATPGYGFRY